MLCICTCDVILPSCRKCALFKLSFTSQNIISVTIPLHESMTMSVCESTCVCMCLKLAWLPMQVLYHTSHEVV